MMEKLCIHVYVYMRENQSEKPSPKTVNKPHKSKISHRIAIREATAIVYKRCAFAALTKQLIGLSSLALPYADSAACGCFCY